ncbi:MAG: DUF3326 domain-containing protein [Candidatus Marinimicrobia bacterium]|nr:DUF3326 domain-containing protein [Candidatus Neomarinimicrobiota bacterium]
MIIYQRDVDIPIYKENNSIISHFEQHIKASLDGNEIPIRFVITQTDNNKYKCELGVLSVNNGNSAPAIESSIFNFAPRKIENTGHFNAVLIIPTGIGAELGGHSGDAGALARLIASSCDKLITHPNVVNASDINELPENGLYVEGSAITSLLMGTVGLQEIRSNRIILIIDKRADRRITDLSINTVSVARAAMGIDCPIVVELDKPITAVSKYSSSGCAVGRIEALENLCSVLQKYNNEYDAVALHTGIDVPIEFHLRYLKSKGEMVNPWGGVEAMLTHSLTMIFGIPTAHAPMVQNMEIANLHAGVVDPRISPEAISSTFLLSVLKGLHKSPRIIRDSSVFGHAGVLTNSDISCLIIPDGCVGLPTLAAMEQGIPVIAVRENKNRMQNRLDDYPFKPGKLFIVDNYLEAVGVMNALKAGVSVESIRRPFSDTRCVFSSDQNEQVLTEVAEKSPEIYVREDDDNSHIITWRQKQEGTIGDIVDKKNLILS